MSTLTPNYGLIVPETTDTVEQVRDDYATNLGLIDNIGGGGGHTIVDPNGTNMPAESKLQFTGNVTVTDDSVNGKTVVNITGGGGGGISNFTETVLATASSFSDMTVDFSTAYDAFIFYTNDVTYQKSENYFFTRSEITDAINNNLTISMYPYGSGGYCQYTITRSGLTRLGNSSGFFIYKIVGLNFGSTPHIYSTSEQVIGTWIDGKPIYQTTYSIGTIAAGASAFIPHNISDFKRLIACKGVGYNTAENRWTELPKVDNDASYQRSFSVSNIDIVIGNSANAQQLTDVCVTLQYTKTTD